MTVTIGNVTFDNVFYDAPADVLYLHVGDPHAAVDFGESPEGHALRFNAAGELVGITMVSPRHFLDRDGKVRITLPQHVEVDRSALDEVLIAA